MSIHAPPTVLSISLTDPTGASGVLADSVTCASMGCHAACAITAVAVQDSARVEDLFLMEAEWINDQARAVLQDVPVAAIKVGALGKAEQVQVVAEILSDYPELPVVFDPFPLAQGSEIELDAELMAALHELVVPQSTVITLSLTQARRWIALATEDEAAEELDAADCARHILQWGAGHVVITAAETIGTHVVNRLFSSDATMQSESIEHVDLRFRGAGDTLSAGIAALLAQGIEVSDAVREANEFLGQALAGGFRLGMGDAVPDRLFWATDDGSSETEGEEGAEADESIVTSPPAA